MNFQNPNLLLENPLGIGGTTAWRCPSNLAIIKYWGKYGVQLPRNPSISLTLNNAYTSTKVSYSEKQSTDLIDLNFRFEGKENEAFRQKQVKFLESIVPYFPFLSQIRLDISSINSFPHSAGIASSASSMAALAVCLCDIENTFFGTLPTEKDFLHKASFIARLGSGSAARSVYPLWAAWGICEGIEGSSNEYAVACEGEVHEVFKTYHDDILIASKGEKSVSSRMGHGLMNQNPYAEPRYAQARERMATLLDALKNGDTHAFGQIAEDEAFTLHALMMCSSPSFTLMKPNTLLMIELVRQFRQDTGLPLYFSLDAGPNLHLLYPHDCQEKVQAFILSDLQKYCENGEWIADYAGKGAIKEKK